MRIRVSGEVGGMIIVAMVGILITGFVAGIFNFIKDRLLKDNEKAKKVISGIVTLIWLIGIALVVLDLTSVFPSIRYLIYLVLGK